MTLHRTPARRSLTALWLGVGLVVGTIGSAAAAETAADPAAALSRTASPTREPVLPRGAPSIGLTQIVSGLNRPLYVTHAGDDRLFVVEQPGRIRILRDKGSGWHITGTFLDIRSRVGDQANEQGLLGLAFHPDYASNGLFYVDYTNNAGDSIIAEFQRESFNQADPGSFRRVMKVNQPFNNHNGGWLGFKGPYLYIAKGDGGAGGDPGDRAQDKMTRLGKILRIDPLDPDGDGQRDYSVPSTNPFVGRPGLNVIWAFGLRNPWRPSFDSLTGDLWLGDVGQELFEEVDHRGAGKGANFGWNLLEGRHRFPSGNLCQSNCKVLPVFEYRHNVGGPNNCSVTGGYVSRRPAADLYGWYLLGDLCTGRIWRIPANHQLGDPVSAPFLSGRTISSFGEAEDKRLYLTDLGGSVYRVNGS